MPRGTHHDIGIRAHRRQFLVGPEAVKVYDDWLVRELKPGVWLSYCPALPMGFQEDRDGVLWCLAGLAVQGETGRGSPLEEIAGATTAEVPERSYNWAGRWTLLNSERLYLDATGLLTCYYGKQGNAHWASSSPALISERLYGDNPPPPLCPKPVYRKGIDWSPPPFTRTKGVCHLIASQSLGLIDGSIAYRPLVPRMRQTEDVAAVIDEVHQRLLTTARNLVSLDQPIWVGLTAGRDSRSVLALCKAAGLTFKTFTRDTLRMSVADHLLPPRLAEMCGVPHEWTYSKPVDPDRIALSERHTAGEVTYGNMLPFITATRDALSGIMIGGHGFELFSVPVLQELPEHTGDDYQAAARTILYDNYDVPDHKPHHTEALARWFRWIHEHPEPQFHWQGRYSMEQENGGWLAHKEQLYDLDRVTRLPLLNCARNYAQLLAIPPEQRLADKVHARLIKATVPELLTLPFNPPDTSFGPVGILRAKSYRLPAYAYGKFRKSLHRFMHDKLNDRAFKDHVRQTAEAANADPGTIKR